MACLVVHVPSGLLRYVPQGMWLITLVGVLLEEAQLPALKVAEMGLSMGIADWAVHDTQVLTACLKSFAHGKEALHGCTACAC